MGGERHGVVSNIGIDRRSTAGHDTARHETASMVWRGMATRGIDSHGSGLGTLGTTTSVLEPSKSFYSYIHLLRDMRIHSLQLSCLMAVETSNYYNYNNDSLKWQTDRRSSCSAARGVLYYYEVFW